MGFEVFLGAGDANVGRPGHGLSTVSPHEASTRARLIRCSLQSSPAPRCWVRCTASGCGGYWLPVRIDSPTRSGRFLRATGWVRLQRWSPRCSAGTWAVSDGGLGPVVAGTNVIDAPAGTGRRWGRRAHSNLIMLFRLVVVGVRYCAGVLPPAVTLVHVRFQRPTGSAYCVHPLLTTAPGAVVSQCATAVFSKIARTVGA